MAPKRKAAPSRAVKAAPKRRSTKPKREVVAELPPPPAPPRAPAPLPPRPPAPPPPSLRGQSFRGTLILVAAALALAAAIVAAFLVNDRKGDFKPEVGVPTGASVTELHQFASAKQPVFWVGPPTEGRLELTKTKSGVYVRYLTPGAKIGDPAASYITIATYPMPGAYAALQQSSRSKGAVLLKTANGAVALWRRARPTSVYLAYPGTSYLVEIYDPNPRRARSLAKSGRVSRVS